MSRAQYLGVSCDSCLQGFTIPDDVTPHCVQCPGCGEPVTPAGR